MLVDCLNLAFSWRHRRPFNFAQAYCDMIVGLTSSYKCGQVILCADKGKSKYRTDISSEYKANRTEKYKEQTEEEKQEFLDFLEEYERGLALAAEKYPLLRFEGVEADDIISVLATHKPPEQVCWIISTDRDLDQLISPTVNRFSYITRKETTISNFREHYDCEPDQYISIKCLQGDTGDNVKGIEGVGPKRANDLIKRYGSAFDIYDLIPGIPGTAKYVQNLNNSGDLILTNYKLMDLSFSEEAVGDNLSDILSTLRSVNGN